jgi:molybdate/tungstate transport system permease protein
VKLSSGFKTEPLSLLFAALGGVVLLFIIAPLISMFVSCSLPELAKTAKDAEVQSSIWLTLWTSMAATVLFAIAAIPFAYLLARKDFPLKGLVLGIIDLPIVIPHSAAGIALLGVLSRSSIMGKAAGKMGFSFIGSNAGIMAAMAFVSIPYLLNSARDGFLAVDKRLEKAALNLGANPLRVFLTISVPLAAKPIISGLILMWARGLSPDDYTCIDLSTLRGFRSEIRSACSGYFHSGVPSVLYYIETFIQRQRRCSVLSRYANL